MGYNRYTLLSTGNSNIESMPYVRISESSQDKYETWNAELGRFDKLSNKYYGSPHYDIFLLLANPQYLNEFDIPDGVVIRIPFPLARVKSEFESKIEFYMKNL